MVGTSSMQQPVIAELSLGVQVASLLLRAP